jgi:hypothetical protein
LVNGYLVFCITYLCFYLPAGKEETMRFSQMTDQQLWAQLNLLGKKLQVSSPLGIAAEKERAILIKEMHKRNLIGYPSGAKFRMK